MKKNFLAVLIFIMCVCLFLTGCMSSNQQYVAPDGCYDNGILIDSKILKITNGNPRMLGSLTKVAVVTIVTLNPQYLPEVKKVLNIIKSMVDADKSTYDILFSYIMQQTDRMDSKYSIGLIFLLQDFSGMNMFKIPISACDKALLYKNITDIQTFFNTIKEVKNGK